MIKVITLEIEDSLVQLVCESYDRAPNSDVEVIGKIDVAQFCGSVPCQTGFGAWKQVSYHHDLHAKPTRIHYENVKELSKKDARKTWLFTHL